MSTSFKEMSCLVAHQIYKGCSSWSDSATNAEKDLKEKRPEQIFNAKWCKGRPWTWLKYDHDENVMTCTIMVNEGKQEI